MLLRQVQERYLDGVLHRKGAWSDIISPDDEIIRKHLEASQTENVIFIVVATPVEEIGRDHDFDWAVIEPSSYRSIIQLAGRVMRHRKLACDIAKPNVAIMQYNLKAVFGKERNVFCHPGFEAGEKYHLQTHDMKCLVEESALAKSIDAMPRLLPAEPLQQNHKLIDLEHCVMRDFKNLEHSGAGYIHGWQSENWWLTGLPQKLNPFRDEMRERIVYRCYNNDGEFAFQEKDERTGEWISKEKSYGIHMDENDYSARSWLERDYLKLLMEFSGAAGCLPEEIEDVLQKKSREYGEIHFDSYADFTNKYLYSDQLGLYKYDGDEV